MLIVLMGMTGAKAFAYDIAAKNADDITIYYVWANDAKTELAVSYNVRYEKTNSDEYSGNVVIPESVTYDGKDYSVTSIGSYAFYYCNNLTSVTIPNSVTSISNYAFQNCIQLTSINIPDNVISIGVGAYANCVSLTSVNIPSGVTSVGDVAFAGCSNLTQVSIPNSMTTIEQGLFMKCTNLSQVTIPISVTTIGDVAFYECSSLISVNIPNSVNTIGKAAFAYCSCLTSINIPNNITTIEDGIFGYCTGLTSITIPNSVNSIGKEAFAGCSGLASITIPSGVTSIGSKAFAECSGLNSIVSEIENPFSIEKDVFENDVYSSAVLFVPSGTDAAYNSTGGWSNFNTILGLGEGGCIGLVLWDGNIIYEVGENYTATVKKGIKELSGDVEIPNQFTYNGKTYSVTSIGESAFYNCSALTSIIIPNSVTSIGSSAFSGCSGLTSVTIPNSVTSIGSSVFSDCSGLTSVTIPSSVTSIGSSAFSGCSGLTSVTIPNSVTSIGGGAFHYCSGLTSITIPNSVTSIGSYAFEGCYNILSLVIGTNVTSIGYNAFYRTHLIKTIWLTNTPPSGFEEARGKVNYVSNDQFTFSNQKTYRLLSSYFEVDGVRYVPVSLSGSEKSCDAIDCIYDESATNINISSTVAYKGITLDLKDVNPYLAYNNKYIKTLTVEYDGGVPDYAFAGCSNMRSVTFGKKVSDIGNNAFFECSSLEAIKIPDKTVSIGSHAFEKCSSLKEIAIGSHVKTINESAFSGCSSLPFITIPHAVTNINNLVFSGCTSLKNVIIADSDMELALGVNEVSSSSYRTGTPLFADCPLDSVYIGRDISYNTTSEYGYSPFYRNSSLRAVKITDKETEISENEFYFCTNLKRVIIGDGITNIGKWAFSGCSSLKSFAFGTQVKSIGQEAFSDCAAMVEIVSKARVAPFCGDQALDDIRKFGDDCCKLYVPSGCIGVYQNADQWKEFIFTEEGTGSIVIDDVLGDANGDGVADNKDLDLVVNSIMEGKNDAKTDINKDGKTDAADVVELVNIIKKK